MCVIMFSLLLFRFASGLRLWGNKPVRCMPPSPMDAGLGSCTQHVSTVVRVARRSMDGGANGDITGDNPGPSFGVDDEDPASSALGLYHSVPAPLHTPSPTSSSGGRKGSGFVTSGRRGGSGLTGASIVMSYP